MDKKKGSLDNVVGDATHNWERDQKCIHEIYWGFCYLILHGGNICEFFLSSRRIFYLGVVSPN